MDYPTNTITMAVLFDATVACLWQIPTPGGLFARCWPRAVWKCFVKFIDLAAKKNIIGLKNCILLFYCYWLLATKVMESPPLRTCPPPLFWSILSFTTLAYFWLVHEWKNNPLMGAQGHSVFSFLFICHPMCPPKQWNHAPHPHTLHPSDASY